MHVGNANNMIVFNYTVCAVVFGTDETILNLPLCDNFSFERRSLIPRVDHLDTIFDMTDMGLRRSFEAARIDTDTVDVICIEKHIRISLEKTALEEWYYGQVDQDLQSLDNQIRSIRLICECALRCNMVAFMIESEVTEHGVIRRHSRIPISESFGTRDISRFHCDNADIHHLYEKTTRVVLPMSNDILNTVHQYYDLSYHQNNYISLTLLVIALEMLFLKKADQKKDVLSKRCSVFMYDTKEERRACCNKLRLIYKQRSNFVHDGVFVGIEDETIIFLRRCVRKALTTIDEACFDKNEFITGLKSVVETIDYLDEEGSEDFRTL